MAKPVAVITSDVATTIPVTSAPYTVHLDGTTSTATGPATIASYQWYLDVPPESAAVLSSATSATPSFVMDVPGAYQARLVVTDSNAVASEGFEVRIDPVNSPYKFKAPSSAYHLVRMSQALTETVPPTSGAKDVAADERELFFVVERLYGQVQSLSAGTGEYVRHVTMAAGSSAADGSAGLPFNPQSAAAGGYDGPVQQAVAELALLGTTNAEVPRTVVMQGGTYDEDVTVTAYGPWRFVPCGYVTFNITNTLTYVASATASVEPSFFMQADGRDAGAMYLGNVVLTGNYAATWSLLWSRVLVMGGSGLTQSGAFAYRAVAIWDDCYIKEALTATDLVLHELDRCYMGDTTSVKYVGTARSTTFHGSVTVTAATATGFYSCAFGSTRVLTGPAGAAAFDLVTIDDFHANACTFSGGASSADYLPTHHHRRQAGLAATITNVGVATSFISSNYIDIGVAAKTRLKIEAILAITTAPGDSYKLELLLTDTSNSAAVAVCTESLAITKAAGVVKLTSDVLITVLGAPGVASALWEYSARSTNLTVDEYDFDADSTTLDLTPAVVRVNCQVVPVAGVGASTFVMLRSLDVDVYKGV